MASLATHFSAFLLLIPLGIRRLLFSSSLYLKNPSVYRSKPWYFSEPRWKNFDFYTLIIALPIASFSEFFFFLTFSGHPTYRFAFFHQAFTLFLFWVFILLVISREHTDPLLINESFVFLFAGISFLIEFSVIGKGITGVFASVYDLLGGLTLLCAASCFYLSVKPAAFFAEFLLSFGLVLKGTWVLQTGLSLYTDAFGLKGCRKMSVMLAKGDADVQCDLEEDGLRGVALMHFLFTVHAVLVLVVTIVLFGLSSSNRNLRRGEASGPLLAELESETMQMRTLSELELE
ncbi:hypothetical protein CMV_007451 [Castanea mollissima]|uniref:Transmembrane protein n=1 Tax=Castanea mollissima TaxID=60419 RepID=A0A8J4R912_9ROSI|nr:hypothetical protein CMV_007451 [Castanea mollissima]